MSDELTRGEVTIVLETGTFTAKVGYADSLSGPTFIKNTCTTDSPECEWPLSYNSTRDIIDVNWDKLGDFWQNEVFKPGLINRRAISESPLLFNAQFGMHHRSHIEQLSQVCFETLQVPALYIASQPLMTLYACGVVNGVVIDIGHNGTNIVPILDSTIQYAYVRRLPVGGVDMMGIGESVQCIDRLFDANEVHLAHHLYDMVRSFDPEKQQILMDHLFITGGTSTYGKFQSRLGSELANTFLSISDYCGDDQPKSFKFLRIPDYFTEMKNKNEHASWFGGSIVSKLVFPSGDGKSFLSRTDYNEHGPRIAWEKPF